MTFRVGHHSTSDDASAYRGTFLFSGFFDQLALTNSLSPVDQTDHALGDPARRLFTFLEKKGLWSEAQDAEFATV
jgi:TPP-dependent pyruvate/acetoin dehydrogenase alpha subunit